MNATRDQITEVVAAWLASPYEPEDWQRGNAEGIANALLPTVERIAKERAADEIRAIAHRLDDNGDEAIEVALGGSAYVHRVLCDCAHALDGKP